MGPGAISCTGAFLTAVLAFSALPSASTTSTFQPLSLATSLAPLIKRALFSSPAEIDTIPSKNSSWEPDDWPDPAPQTVATITLNANTIKARGRNLHLAVFPVPNFWMFFIYLSALSL
jgi:hypothetical protein